VCAGRGRRIAIDVQWTPDRYNFADFPGLDRFSACHMRISASRMSAVIEEVSGQEVILGLAPPSGKPDFIVRIVLSTSFL